MLFNRHTLALAVALLLAPSPALPQALSGTIVGSVTDESGAAIANVSVTLTNTATGFTRTVATNSSGQYVAPTIPTGTYAIAVEKPGFRKLIREGIALSAADTATVNLSLAVGDVKQAVEVTASAPLLEAQNADVSQ